MHISDFDYDLPPDRIATEPANPRDSARMMVVGKTSGSIEDRTFRDLPDILQSTDILVLNDTRVIKARVFGRLERTNGTARDIEVLFANPASNGTWEVLCRPGKRVRPGDRIIFGDGAIGALVAESLGHGVHRLTLEDQMAVSELLDRFGHVPLPPYIERMDRSSDASNYQTIFARHEGAVAAPTAGLHFTPEVRRSLEAKGVQIVTITLHVGIGTFMPVRNEDPTLHKLRAEWFQISDETAKVVREGKSKGRRVIAVGTTATRTLEYVMQEHDSIVACEGFTDLFILPGYQFRILDGLLTNFHLPKSTLLMLVSAFTSPEHVHRAYRHAIDDGYRFYSYGDCMLVI